MARGIAAKSHPSPVLPPLSARGAMKLRQYVHFDRRISKAKAIEIIGDPCEVKGHRFYPFLAFTKRTRKIKWDKGKKRLVRQLPKPRNIKYACHADSAIYSYYADELSRRYEPILEKEGLTENVTAFRSLDGKTNIEEYWDGTDPRESADRLTAPVITLQPSDVATTAG